MSDKLAHPDEKQIPTNYKGQMYREYALIEAVREVAAQLRTLNENLLGSVPAEKEK